jgi:hypothetical protein
MSKHTDRYQTTDSCRIHGIGLSVCRVCVTHNVERVIYGKHRAKGPALVGYPRP